jgi:hypothetical protein
MSIDIFWLLKFCTRDNEKDVTQAGNEKCMSKCRQKHEGKKTFCETSLWMRILKWNRVECRL